MSDLLLGLMDSNAFLPSSLHDDLVANELRGRTFLRDPRTSSELMDTCGYAHRARMEKRKEAPEEQNVPNLPKRAVKLG